MGWFKKKSKKKKMETLTSGQRQLLDSLTGTIQGQVGRGIDPYRGELAAGPSELQQSAFGMAEDFFGSDARQARGSALAEIVAGRPAYDVNADEYERIYREGVEAPAYRSWERTIIPQILQQYGAAGPSGAVVSALGDSGKDLATNLAAERAQYRFAGEEARQQALESAAGRRLAGIESLRTEELTPIELAARMGEVQRGIRNEQNVAEYSRWEMAQPWANPWLGFLPAALGTQAFQPYIQPERVKGWAQILSGVMNPTKMLSSLSPT